jgi:hypothetical protein
MWNGWKRIVPGDPTDSLLVQLITHRGTDNLVGDQMPPIATLIVDQTDSQKVIDWIAKMPKLPSDAGSESGAPPIRDAGRDATVVDGGGLDGAVDASPVDAGPDVGDATLGDDTGGNGSDGEVDDGNPGDAGSTPATED